jgi:hypothetical protein
MPQKKETPSLKELNKKPTVKHKANVSGACKICDCPMFIRQPLTPNECGREGCGHTILEHA